jgi:NAD-dependent deacetylase
MEPKLAQILEEIRASSGRVVALTGAGISAESGIPTFRGKEGYWVVGSRNYLPQEMATKEMFDQRPEEVWRWYLYRFGVCRMAQPNAGHAALVTLEARLGDRFTLVTQNIDGLHRRAGSRRVFTIHGDAAWVRCAAECGLGRIDQPDLGERVKAAPLSAADRAALTCPRCGGWLRPHVLWFDECYDEENYSMDSALRAAGAADLPAGRGPGRRQPGGEPVRRAGGALRARLLRPRLRVRAASGHRGGAGPLRAARSWRRPSASRAPARS